MVTGREIHSAPSPPRRLMHKTHTIDLDPDEIVGEADSWWDDDYTGRLGRMRPRRYPLG